MTEIARGPGGYVLPLGDQPWADGHRTPKEMVLAWEEAKREDWVRTDAWLEKEREAQVKSAGRAKAFLVALGIAVQIGVVWKLTSDYGEVWGFVIYTCGLVVSTCFALLARAMK